MALIRQNHVTSTEEWRFDDSPEVQNPKDYPIQVRPFPLSPELLPQSLGKHLKSAGQPDLIWVEGRRHPPYLAELFHQCPNSFKIVYTKHWEPWSAEELEHFDLLLVDDVSQVKEVNRQNKNVACAVWDKLVDYEVVHRPREEEKIYDACYTAKLVPRKKHELLIKALADLRRPDLRCVFIGPDRRDRRGKLEQLAHESNIAVDFTGDVGPEMVNYYVSRSRIGVICSRRDAAPRALLEYLAADVPVLVNSELVAGSRYVSSSAGLVLPPKRFHKGIDRLLKKRHQYRPREHYLANYSIEKVASRFMNLVGYAKSKKGSSG